MNDGAAVEERTQFSPTSHLAYSIEPTSQNAISAAFEGSRVVVRVPKSLIADWATSDQVGLESRQGELKIVIEKDFECSNPEEPQADAFPNPNKCS